MCLGKNGPRARDLMNMGIVEWVERHNRLKMSAGAGAGLYSWNIVDACVLARCYPDLSFLYFRQY